MEPQPVSPKLEDNKRLLEKQAGLGESFDLVIREMEIAGRPVFFFYVNGLIKEEAMIEVLKRLTFLERGELSPKAVETLLSRFIPHVQVDEERDMKAIVTAVLAGGSAMFVDGERVALVIDAKSFPNRSIEEPDLERVVRGSRDGFNEMLLTNVSLVRRRIRDPGLRLLLRRVGRRSATDVCVAYIADIADPDLVQSILRKLENTQADGLAMADKQLEELILGKSWNPFPQVRYSERPDVVATHLLEGHVVLFVDTSPSVMILPTTLFHLIQHAEEYRQTPPIGSYIRWVRYIGILSSVFLLPLWYLMVENPGLKPPGFDFIGPNKEADLPLLLQFFLAEIGIDLMRMAAVHTPTPLATAMGLIAAVLVGEIAVSVGLFVYEVILYIAVAALGMFATPNYELSMANRLVRLILLAAAALFKVPGLVTATTLILLYLILHRSFNSPYLWPFIPFNAKAAGVMLIRRPYTYMKRRPSLNKTQDSTRRR